MQLVSAYGDDGTPPWFAFLWLLLVERDESVNISHKAMPTWEGHCRFVVSRPYPHWYVALVNKVPVGAVYLTDRREIGLFILGAERGKGYGSEVLRLIRERHPGPMLANVAFTNAKGMVFWMKHGFEFKQITLEHPECLSISKAATVASSLPKPEPGTLTPTL